MSDGVRMRWGGHGERVLLLLHGMGATGDVWRKCEPMLARDWPGRWVAPDLPGHGGSRPLGRYTFHDLAAGVAAALRDLPGGCPEVVVLGHSLGGAVGLALAASDLRVTSVVGLGIKAVWSEAELAKARELGGRPPAWFATRDEAAARYLKVSGLAGLVDPDDPAVDAGLHERDGRWRLAMDPAVFAIGAPDLPALIATARARVLLARGEHDPMVSDQDLARLGVPTVTLAGLGHNAHLEDPESAVRLCPAG